MSLHPEDPANDGWQEIFHQHVSHHRGWPTVSLPLPPPVNPNVKISPAISPVESLHANKILKNDIPQPMQDKVKAVVSPSIPSIESSKFVSSCLHLKDDLSHVINEIQPQGSNQPRATQVKSIGDNSEKNKYSSQRCKYGF